MANIFVKILNLSISAGLITILIVLFRFFIKKHSHSAACLLWAVVGLRLILPVTFETDFGILPGNDYVTVPEKIQGSDRDSYPAEKSKQNIQDKNTNDDLKPYGSDQYNVTDINNLPDGYLQEVIPDNDPDTFRADGIQKSSIESVVGNAKTDTISNDLPVSDNMEPIKADASINDEVSKNDIQENRQSLFGLRTESVFEVVGYIWILGMLIMLVYALAAYIRMRSITSESVVYGEKGVKLCDRIETPFIIGTVHPTIMLPPGLSEIQYENVLAHEKRHLLRRDHIWKFLGFLLLTVYWFNPLMWIAYILLCRDIEYACDEQVIAGMDTASIKEYSNTLLSCSSGAYLVYGCPLAFGEVAVKDRIKAALNYKKPGFWIFIVVLIICVGTCIVFFTKSGSKSGENTETDNKAQDTADADDNRGKNDAQTKDPSADPEGGKEIPDKKGMADEYVLDGKKYTLIPDGTKTVETALYRINIPEKWAGNVHYHVSEDNSIIFRGYTNISAPIDSELISITPVTSVDEAWKMVDELPGCCIFSKDYVYVFRLPETAPQQSYKKDDLRLGIDEISSFAEGLEILKDGGSGAAINSIHAEHLERILAPEKNNKVSDMHERHYLGLYRAWTNYYNYEHSVYSLSLFDFVTPDGYTIDEMLLLDHEKVLHLEFPAGLEKSGIYISSFDYNNDGINEYEIIDPIEGTQTAEFFICVEERLDEASDRCKMYELDQSVLWDEIRKRITEKVDVSTNRAQFFLDGTPAIVVESGHDLEDKEYELKGISVWNEDGGYGIYAKSPLLPIKTRAGLKLANSENSDPYDYDYAPLISADVMYEGKGQYRITDLRIRRFGMDIREIDFSDKYIFSEKDEYLVTDPKDGTEVLVSNPYTFKDGYETGRVKIVSVGPDGNIVVKFLKQDESDYPDEPEDFTKVLQQSEEITLKLSDDCLIYYFPKKISDWNWRKITEEDLKYLVDNYYYFSDAGTMSEYLMDFECCFKDGEVYYLAERYHP